MLDSISWQVGVRVGIESKDEYVALRAEQLMRFDRIFETVKLLAPAILAAIAFEHSDIGKKMLTPDWWLVLLQSLLLLAGLMVLNEFRAFYRVGTYIALFCESPPRSAWLRMVRQYSDFVASPQYLKLGGDPKIRRRRGLIFPFGERWGEDTTVVAAIIFFLDGSLLGFEPFAMFVFVCRFQPGC